MPELPELDALAEALWSRCAGSTIARVEIGEISVLHTATPPLTVLEGQRLTAIARRGKYLTFRTPPASLTVHLARAGWLKYVTGLGAAPVSLGRGPLALRIRFDDGSGIDLTEAGTRKGAAARVSTEGDQLPQLTALGPEADLLDAETFAALCASSGARVKTILTDQHLLAGIGNGYSDEILHTARLSPYAVANRLDAAEVSRLHAAVASTLAAARATLSGQRLDRIKATKKAGYRVHARTGQPCPVCGSAIAEVSFADRSLQYCPACQTGGRKLSDRRMDRLLK